MRLSSLLCPHRSLCRSSGLKLDSYCESVPAKKMKNLNYLARVREQYENYPYPLRKPKEELKRLRLTSLDQLPVINHHCFGGCEDFSNARVLVAGGGTGDAAIYLAEQLKHTRSTVTYLDISRASMKVAKKRAKMRKLKNIKWVHGSLLDLPRSGLGKFKYINCSGVLHHLEDPSAGLLALQSVLEDDGAIGLMVYAKYGRFGIYQVQDLMKLINKGEEDINKQISDTRTILSSLPETNWFIRGEELAVDHRENGDIGYFDLFLHSQDRAYSIPELHQWLNSCGLNFTGFVFEKARYDPAQYIDDKSLLKKISGMPEAEQHAVAELLSGAITKHTFYCSPTRKAPPDLHDDEMVPFLWGTHISHMEVHTRLMEDPSSPVEFVSLYLTIDFSPTRYSAPVFKYMDGNNTIAQIMDKTAEELNIQDKVPIRKEINAIYAALDKLNQIFLKQKNVGKFTPEVTFSVESIEPV